MSISRQNLTVIIVTFKSEKVIHDCIQSIDSEIKILIIDNSNSKIFKENLEKKYENVSCILSEKNLGMGAGNNLGIKNVKTDFAFIFLAIIDDTNVFPVPHGIKIFPLSSFLKCCPSKLEQLV